MIEKIMPIRIYRKVTFLSVEYKNAKNIEVKFNITRRMR